MANIREALANRTKDMEAAAIFKAANWAVGGDLSMHTADSQSGTMIGGSVLRGKIRIPDEDGNIVEYSGRHVTDVESSIEEVPGPLGVTLPRREVGLPLKNRVKNRVMDTFSAAIYFGSEVSVRTTHGVTGRVARTEPLKGTVDVTTFNGVKKFPGHVVYDLDSVMPGESESIRKVNEEQAKTQTGRMVEPTSRT